MRLASILMVPAVMGLVSLTACEPTIPEGRFACESDEDCPDELVCRTRVRRCFSTQADAGPSPDAATNDAAVSDSGPSDAGPRDAGPSDAALTDADVSDSGPSDADDGSAGDAAT
jgi:hypothetical protein